MPIQVVAAANAPASRAYGAARSLPEFDEAIKAAEKLSAGNVVVITVTPKMKEALGGDNALNSLAQGLRVAFRQAGWTQRVAYTSKPDKVCIRVGTPRKNQKKEKSK